MRTQQDLQDHIRDIAARFNVLFEVLSRQLENGKNGFELEFEKLCAFDSELRRNDAEFSTSKLPSNRMKNRYTDVHASVFCTEHFSVLTSEMSDQQPCGFVFGGLLLGPCLLFVRTPELSPGPHSFCRLVFFFFFERF